MTNRKNSFDIARFLAASGVIFSHHFPISGYVEPEFLGFTLGSVSVYVFFLMSGYLICNSVINNSDFSRFLAARLLRIIPNLTFVLITLVTYGNYANILLHLRYILQNEVMLVRGGPLYDITGVFADRPELAINGSLWTLPYEVWCYFILYLTVANAKKILPPILAIWICVCGALALFIHGPMVPGTRIGLNNFGELGTLFFLGALFAARRMKLPFLSSPRMAWFSKWGDPSYGMYIFAWPVQQYCAILVKNFWLSMLLALILTTLIGYTTWHVFERKFLLRVDFLASRIKILGSWQARKPT
jgi:peptidoglycan/LPS O-acetylase OafA/YrhL